ncbi:hypothetical protein ACHAXS_005263, partial [Conticribra weissflogii]
MRRQKLFHKRTNHTQSYQPQNNKHRHQDSSNHLHIFIVLHFLRTFNSLHIRIDFALDPPIFIIIKFTHWNFSFFFRERIIRPWNVLHGRAGSRVHGRILFVPIIKSRVTKIIIVHYS